MAVTAIPRRQMSEIEWRTRVDLGLSQISGVDGSSSVAADFTLHCRGAVYDPECDCRECMDLG